MDLLNLRRVLEVAVNDDFIVTEVDYQVALIKRRAPQRGIVNAVAIDGQNIDQGCCDVLSDKQFFITDIELISVRQPACVDRVITGAGADGVVRGVANDPVITCCHLLVQN